MENVQRILVCPLNWGLGHATRCIPLINRMLNAGKEVIIASDGYPLELLKSEFPHLTFIHFPSYQITYGKGNSQVWAMLKSLPKILLGIYREHQCLKKIIAYYQIDTVLSDNRFGLWNKQIRSIYMTHQLMIKMPCSLKFLEPLAWLIHRFFINRYDVCLIPDQWENGGLAGDLTHKYPLPKNGKFIGTLSRFANTNLSENPDSCEIKVFCALSGIEPQRSIFENILIDKLSKEKFKSLIVQGLPVKNRAEKQIEQITIVSHLPSCEMERYLRNTPVIICRSGYSSVMDLSALHRTAILVPTPGQTEQEYLAKYLAEKGLFTSMRQEALFNEFVF